MSDFGDFLVSELNKLEETRNDINKKIEQLHAALDCYHKYQGISGVNAKVELVKQNLDYNKEDQLWYVCMNCGDESLEATMPMDIRCNGCNNPKWKIKKLQYAWFNGMEEWEHPEGVEFNED